MAHNSVVCVWLVIAGLTGKLSRMSVMGQPTSGEGGPHQCEGLGRSDHTRQSFMTMKHVSSPGIHPRPQDLPHWGKIFQLPFSIWSQFPKEHTFYGPGKPLLGLFGNQLWFFSPDSINRILLCGAGTELRSLASWCDIPSSWDSALSSPQEAKGSCALSCCVQLFFFLPLQNKHLSIRCIFKEMDQHGYSGRHKAHWGVGQISNLRKSRSLYINHTFTIIGRRLNSLSVRATLALLGTFGGAPQTLSSCIHFLPWLFYFIADFILIRQEEEEEETENCKLIS